MPRRRGGGGRSSVTYVIDLFLVLDADDGVALGTLDRVEDLGSGPRCVSLALGTAPPPTENSTTHVFFRASTGQRVCGGAPNQPTVQRIWAAGTTGAKPILGARAARTQKMPRVLSPRGRGRGERHTTKCSWRDIPSLLPGLLKVERFRRVRHAVDDKHGSELVVKLLVPGATQRHGEQRDR